MNFLQLENAERYGALDREAWAVLAQRYTALRKSRALSQKRLYRFNTLSLWLCVLALVLAGAAALAIGWPGALTGGTLAVGFALIAWHLNVTAQRNYYEMRLAKQRAREINRWLNGQAGNAGAP